MKDLPHPDWTTTSTTLLDALRREEDGGAWHVLNDRMRPILLSCCRRRGLGPEDSADVAQEAFVTFIRAYRDGQYAPERGRLRGFIVGILNHRILDHLRKHEKSEDVVKGSAIDRQPEQTAELERMWTEECRTYILGLAIDRLRSQTGLSEKKIRAFEEMARRKRGVDEVAAELGMTPEEVHHAKFDCLTRVRGLVQDIEELYAPLL